jgi:hypothetical protein
VVPLDGSELSKRALEQATILARDCHASLLLVAPLPTHSLEGEVVVDEIVGPVPGGPYAGKWGADLLIIPRRKTLGLSRRDRRRVPCLGRDGLG